MQNLNPLGLVRLAIAEQSKTPVPASGAGNLAWSTITEKVMQWNGTAWTSMYAPITASDDLVANSIKANSSTFGITTIERTAKTGSDTPLVLSSSDSSNKFQLLFTRGANASHYLIQSVEQSVGYKPLALQPHGANLLVGALTDDNTHKVQVAGKVRIDDTLLLNGAVPTINLHATDSNYGMRRDGTTVTLASSGELAVGAGSTGTIKFNQSSTTQMMLSASGNTLIGATADDGSGKLQVDGGARIKVSGSGAPYVKFDGIADSPVMEFQRWSGSASNYRGIRIKDDSTGALTFETSNLTTPATQVWSEKMRLSQDGNLLIGTNVSDGTSKLQVDGGISGTTLRITSASAQVELGSMTAAGTPYVDFHSSGTGSDYDVRLITSGGNATPGSGKLNIIATQIDTDASLKASDTNRRLQGFSVLQSGYVEDSPVIFRFDQDVLRYASRKPGVTFTYNGFSASEADILFSAYASFVNLKGKGDGCSITVEGINYNNTYNAAWWPFVYMHAGTSGLRVVMEVKTTNATVTGWQVLYDGDVSNYYIAQTSSAPGALIGARWTFYGHGARDVYIRSLGVIGRNSDAYAWNVMKGGDTMYGGLTVLNGAGLTLDTLAGISQNQIYFKQNGVLKSQLTSNYGDGNFYLLHNGVNALKIDSAGAIQTANNLLVTGPNLYLRADPATGNGMRIQHNAINGYIDFKGDFYIRGGGAAGDANTSVLVKSTGRTLFGTTVDDGTSRIQVNGDIATNVTRIRGGGSLGKATIIEGSVSGAAPMYIRSGDATTPGEQIIIGDVGSGNVLIGTAVDDTSNKLQVNGPTKIISGTTSYILNNSGIGEYFSGSSVARWLVHRDGYGSGQAGIRFSGINGTATDTNGSVVGTTADRSLGIKTSNGSTLVERLRVTGNGNVLVNTTTDDGVNKLQVSGSAAVSDTLKTKKLVITSTDPNDDFSLKTATASLQLNTGWTDFGISGSDLATGTYAVQLFANDNAVGGEQWLEYYSGLMSWFAEETNSTSTSEIILHRAGHAPGNNILYLRVIGDLRISSGGTGKMRLQIASEKNHTGTSTYTIKFRRMI